MDPSKSSKFRWNVIKMMKGKNNKSDEALKLLKGAYKIKTPEDNKLYYKNFSINYDSTFVEYLEYIYPKQVATELLENFKLNGPICDIGCGTGLVGKELYYLNKKIVVDGLDISPEMIKEARKKNIYRNFYDIDLTKKLIGVPNNYAAIVSSGTFTHGHLGPEYITKILSLCRDNAVLTLGINLAHYLDKEFEKIINKLESTADIKILNISKKPIYSKQNETGNEKNNTAIIFTFLKTR